MLAEGWYLMSVADLERELRRFREGPDAALPSDALPLSTKEALIYRDAGNLPDERGRTLRLVLRVEKPEDLQKLDEKRRRYEPDYLEPPRWRRTGSAPVNLVPLRSAAVEGSPRPWWQEPRVAVLEREWHERGTVEGVRVPAEYRSFVYKTVIALREAGHPVTVESICGAVERWTSRGDATRIRAALEAANR